MKIKDITLTAVLMAIAITIPMYMPKIVIPPASFTLGSHVPIFIACFFSPLMAVLVSVGAAVGFFFAGFPLVVVARAATHVVFATLAGVCFRRFRGRRAKMVAQSTELEQSQVENEESSIKSQTAQSNWLYIAIVALIVSLVHAAGEIIVVQTWFFPSVDNPILYVLGFVGLGTLIHSLIDFSIAFFIWRIIYDQIQKYDSKV